MKVSGEEQRWLRNNIGNLELDSFRARWAHDAFAQLLMPKCNKNHNLRSTGQQLLLTLYELVKKREFTCIKGIQVASL